MNLPSPTIHGALDFAELERLGLHPDQVLDFSVNSNPFGPSPTALAALANTPIERYPDRDCLALRRELADRLHISVEQIMIGNGTAELIWLAAFTFFRPNEPVLILGPTFGEYERATRLMNAQPLFWTAHAETGFAFDAVEITRLLDTTVFQAVFLCNPNNPTGQVLPKEIIAGWAKNHPQTLFIVDEAYLAFVPGMETTLQTNLSNLFILRSLTKDYALAGLRLGCAVGNEKLIQALSDVRPAWNVNAMAQSVGLAALKDENHLQESLARLRVEKEFMFDGLISLGYNPIPSKTQFFLVPIQNASGLRQKLLTTGILVRDCTSFGLPNHIRISPRQRHENLHLLEALRNL